MPTGEPMSLCPNCGLYYYATCGHSCASLPVITAGDTNLPYNYHSFCYTCGMWHATNAACYSMPGWQPLTTFQPTQAPHQARITLLPGATMPTFGTPGSIGFDLYASKDEVIENGQHKLISTGLIIEPPDGYWMMIASRSSTIKRGLILANGVGVVDPDYCGPADEIKLSLLNVSPVWSYIKQGDRLAQGIFVPVPPKFSWSLNDGTGGGPSSRGGFGSTGL